jgi:Fic family protein
MAAIMISENRNFNESGISMKDSPDYEDIVKMWQSFHIDDATKLSAYLNGFAVHFAYNSGAIENAKITYHDTHEIFENGMVINYTGDLKTLYEIENMKHANDLILKWFDDRVEITQDKIKELHGVLTRGTYDERRWTLGERPGEFKKNDIWGIGKNEIAAPLSEIEADLEEDLAEIKDIRDKDALIAAAWFHARFEGIHAFADGNGRVGRAIMNYLLVLHNHPPIVIYNEDKQLYYDALDQFDESGDLEPMIALLKAQTIKTWIATFKRYNATSLD